MHSPPSVRHGRDFTVTVGLRVRADVTIALLSGRKVIDEFDRENRVGTIKQTIGAPRRTGNYTVKVTADGGGVTQTVMNPLKVT